VDTPEYFPGIPPVHFTTNDAADPPTHYHNDDAHANYNTTNGKANALFGAYMFIDALDLPSATDTLSHPDDISKKSASSALSASSFNMHYQYDDKDHLHLDHLLIHSNYHSNITSKYQSNPHLHLHPTNHPDSSTYSYQSNTHTNHNSCPYDDDSDSNDARFEQEDYWQIPPWFIVDIVCLIH